jgi:rod shape-determining protein MreC
VDVAPPRKRRPGYDRKAQYGLFASYVVALSGAIASLFLVIVWAADPTGFSLLRSTLAEITRPVSAGLTSIVSTIGNSGEAVSAYVDAGSKNRALAREVAANRTRLIEADAIALENVRLKRLLHLVETDNGAVAVGRLIASSSSNSRRFARIDKGWTSGVKAGMPVRSPEGLIGRVLWTSPSSAEILLLADSENVVPVRLTRNGAAGLSRGLNDGTLEVRPLNVGANPYRPGDIFVTSGIGGIYRPNIPVGFVIRIEGDRAIAVPLARPGQVEMAIVQRGYQPPVVMEARPPAPATDAPAPQGGTSR